jgi:transmembrane sensor
MKMDSEENIKTAARDWLLRLSLDSPTPDEQARFAAWCRDDPRHLAAYRRFESIWQDAATLESLAPLAALPVARDPWWRRTRASFAVHPLRWAGSACLVMAAAGIGIWLLRAPLYYATGLAEVREIHLSDGSEVTLGARSSLEVAFRFHARRVVLNSGVAFFSVAKNPSRPFVVRVGDQEVRVVGTQFEIRRDPDAMRVSVVEGAVEVVQVPDRVPAAVQEAPRSMTAGQQVTTALAGAIPDPQVMPRGEAAAWRYGRLVYVDAPLKDIVADANRYSHAPIKLADAGIANIRVSVTYPSDKVEEMVTALSRSLSLEIEHPVSGGIVLKPRQHAE